MKKIVLAIFIAMLTTVGASAQSTNPLNSSEEIYAVFLNVYTTPRYLSYEDEDYELIKRVASSPIKAIKCNFDFEVGCVTLAEKKLKIKDLSTHKNGKPGGGVVVCMNLSEGGKDEVWELVWREFGNPTLRSCIHKDNEYAILEFLLSQKPYYDEFEWGDKIDDIEDIKPEINAVDLGLSVKWADRNLGAFQVSDRGDYYSWGEIETKEDYSEESYKWYVVDRRKPIEIIKYFMDKEKGFEGSKLTLEKADDAAQKTLGGKWRMPTVVEIDELLENCYFRPDKINGINGYKCISKKNGNSIFFPFTGYRINKDFNQTYIAVYCWSSTVALYGDGAPYMAHVLKLDEDHHSKNKSNQTILRFIGATIRPVSE